MSTALIFLREYFLNPEKYWKQTHQRNAVKLRRFLISGADGIGLGRHVRDLINLAVLRSRLDPMHVYIVNMGSSGSHWIESMLGMLPGFYNGGEIYPPNELRKILTTLSPLDARTALDALYLAHLGTLRPDLLNAKISNSAHLANHQEISKFSSNKKTILLLRNPLDVVMSRTFRKNEYRKDIAPGVSNQEYLEQNCRFVENFAQVLDLKTFDLIVKYEDFYVEPLENLKRLAALLRIESTSDSLRKSVDFASKESVAVAVANGEKAINNIYLGERSEEDWAVDYARKRLSGVTKMLGYS